jgi:hypothetical protein
MLGNFLIDSVIPAQAGIQAIEQAPQRGTEALSASRIFCFAGFPPARE